MPVFLRTALPQGGETAALARLKHYLWDSDCIASYFDTRNGMLGPDYSTKLAPWLSAGCISPRTIYHQVSMPLFAPQNLWLRIGGHVW